MNEGALDNTGVAPLLHVAKVIRRLFKGNDTDITTATSDGLNANGLTAALAFLHSRGTIPNFPEFMYILKSFTLPRAPGIDGLFSFDIEGDVGVDPEQMVLWFNQPDLGLPSKVRNATK